LGGVDEAGAYCSMVGRKGMKTNIVEHNFKVGGKWKYVMAMPDRSEFIGEGV